MEPPVSGAWGKLRQARLPDGRKGAPEAWHPLTHHCVDVAACFEVLCRLPGIRRALDAAACSHGGAGARRLDDADLERLGVIAFLHDIGKVNRGFWSKHDPSLRMEAGHVDEARILLDGQASTPRAQGLLRALRLHLPLVQFKEWGAGATVRLLLASIAHHGGPTGRAPIDALTIERIWSASGAYDPAEEMRVLVDAARRMFPRAFESFPHPLPDAPRLQHLFAGLVQLADWLGSDADPLAFPFAGSGMSVMDRIAFARARAVECVRRIGIDPTPARKAVGGALPDFGHLFGMAGMQPRAMQDLAAEPGLGRLVILEAETGSGKTEAALWRFLRLWMAGDVDGLYFALPTRVAATQLHERVRRMVERLVPGDARPGVVRALSGHEAFDEHEIRARLPGFEVLWADRPADRDAHCRWAAESPKRFLAAPIAVGTIDQALLGALQVRHAHMRQASLSRSLLVIDEVHASDAYMTQLTRRLLQAHLALGGHAMLLSATLGSAARETYLADARQATGLACADMETMPLSDAVAMPYPLLLGERACAVPALRGAAAQGASRSKTVRWTLLDAMNDPGRVAALALDAARAGAKVLIVRNTVKQALATQRELEQGASAPEHLFSLPLDGGRPVVTLHHGRFARSDRLLLDRQVEKRFGKDRLEGGCVLVGTQTLEQSLDIDCDLLITDLCPADVLLQRIGRLHRHERSRPVGFESARCIVLQPDGGDLSTYLPNGRDNFGLGRQGSALRVYAYADLLQLEATRGLVRDRLEIMIPAMNRELVERTTHEEALAGLGGELDAEWMAQHWEVMGLQVADRTRARTVALDCEQSFDRVDPFTHDQGDIGTRLGLADVLVRVEPPVVGPLGQAVASLVLPHHMIRGPERFERGADGGPVASEVRQDADGSFTFAVGGGHYRYSRLGLEASTGDRGGGAFHLRQSGP